MPKKVKLIVSDFHLGKGRYFKDGTQNLLEDFIYDKEFSEFVEYYCTGHFKECEVEIILNGDILNLLQIDSYGVHTHMITERSVVRALERIIDGHPEFFSALRKFGRVPGHTVSYVVGNHDVGMLWEKPRKLFSEAIGGVVRFFDISYRFDGIHVEHGQQYEHFSKTDTVRPFITRGLPEPVLNLPWGSLFVAVLLPKLKQERPHVDKVKPFSALIRWCFLHDTLWTLKALLTVGKFMFDTVLFRRRHQIKSGFKTTANLLKEITVYPSYDKIAFKVLEENPEIHTVIFGHIHQVRYRKWREGKDYFNEGTWNEATNLELSDFGTQVKLTYAYIEYPEQLEMEPERHRPQVRLKQWRGIWRPEVDIVA